MPDWFIEGGIAMWPLLGCSIACVAVIIERIWALQRSRVISPALAKAIEKRPASEEQLEITRELTHKDRTVLGELAKEAFAHASLQKAEALEAVQAVARQALGRLERGLTTLSIIAELGPMLGLLGTVTGMVRLFADVARHGLADPSLISKGISEALIATFSGLSVAIPALIAYMYLRRRVELLSLEMERHTNELMSRLYRPETVK